MEPFAKRNLLASLPSVDEVLKSEDGNNWLSSFPRKIVLQAVRDIISGKRARILEGGSADLAQETLSAEIAERIRLLSSRSLVSVINATGVVIHTNLGRAPVSERALAHIADIGKGYSTLEYDLTAGRRGKRHVHTQRLLREITGAEDALVVNNNAAAVLLCLNTLARGKEVIVSRGELVEIGGSFRVPDVMAASGATLRETGTTNKTHPSDYVSAITENTALLLKVHQSNYRIIGFTEDVNIGDLVAFGRNFNLPVMFDLGSGCLVDLRPYGIHGEPTVQEIIASGVDLVTFSGDKLLGGPQGGIIAGKKSLIEKIRKNPLARAVRVDKLTIAAFEATLMDYMDLEKAKKEIPVLSMLLDSPEEIKARALKIASGLKKKLKETAIEVVSDYSMAGGGSLPEKEFPTFVVSVVPSTVSVNELESRLRKGNPPVIARIKSDALLLDARTIRPHELTVVTGAVIAALEQK